MSVSQTWQEFAAAAAKQAGDLHVNSVAEKVRALHRRIHDRHAAIERIAIALFDPESRQLKTFVDSTDRGTSLSGYSCSLDEVPSLAAIAKNGEPRILNDLSIELHRDSPHSAWLNREGYLSSLTLPIRNSGQLLGFVFFDARERNAFSAAVVSDLLLSGDLMGMIIAQELATIRMLVCGLRLASEFAHVRDLETGAHLDRMSRYARLIARHIGPAHGKPADYAENVFLFAPLHDIGKVGIPDAILLKPGRLDDKERDRMRHHVSVGLQMTEQLIRDFGLESLSNINMLRNIVSAHHERMDGSGYPNGIAGDDIPLEARIVATADVFDALACKRHYKPAWTLEDAYKEIARMAEANELYKPTVDALLNNRAEVEHIFDRFQTDEA
jgi:HD-GYP domain-containing protein (c-di-GMP phosphodiesterase class II)